MTDKRIRIILDSKDAQREAKKLDKDVKSIGKSADNTVFAVKRLASAIAGAFATQKVIQYADAFTSIENQIRRTVDTQEDLIRTTGDLLAVSNDTRSSLSATTALYTSLSISTKSLGTSQKDVIGITKTINNLFLEAGKSAAETEGAIRQLGQALESGALRGDEFNSVAEGAPGILRAIEQQTGKTRAELRELAADGEITAELLVSSLQSYEDQAQSASDATRATFGQSLVVAENNAIAFVGALSLVQDATGLAGSAIVTVSENLEVLVNLAGAAAAVYVARLIPSIIQSGVAFSQQAAAALRTTTVMNSYGQVVSRTTALTRASTVAVRGLTAAMSFFGGPAGIAFLAIAALTTYTIKADSAATSSETLANKTDVLTQSIKNLTAAQAESQRIDVVSAISEQEEAVDSLQAKIDRMQITTKEGFTVTFDSFDNSELIKAEAAIDSAKQKLDELRSRLADLNGIVDGSSDDPFGFGDSDPFAVSGNNNDSSDSTDNGKPKESQKDDSVSRAKSTTAALQRELDARKEISAIYRQGELDAMASQFEQERAMQSVEEQVRVAEAEAKYAEDLARREERFLASLENDAIENEQKKALKTEFENQNLISAQLLQNELTTIEKQGANDREAIARAEAKTRLSNAAALGNSLISLGQGQSSKIFKIGQKLALAQAAVALPTAVLESFKNGGGYPWGLVPAGAMLASGLKNIQSIRSAGSGLGGGGGSMPSVSLPTGGASAQPSVTSSAVQSQPQAQQPRLQITIENDIFGVGNKINDALKDLERNGVQIAGSTSR